MFGLIPVTIIAITKRNTNNMFYVVRFDTATLSTLISLQTFSSSRWLRVMIHICFSLLRYGHRSKMSHCFSHIFRYDSGSSIKLLSSKTKNMFLLSMVWFYPGRPYYHPCRFKAYRLIQLSQLHHPSIC